MEKQVKKYLKWEYSKGKTVAAMLIDALGIRTAVFFGGCFAFLLLTKTLVPSIILAAIVTFAFSWVLYYIEKNSFEKFSADFMGKLQKQLFLEKILVMPKKERYAFFREISKNHLEGEVKEYCNGFVSNKKYVCFFDRHPKSEITPHDILLCIRDMQSADINEVICYSLCEYSKDAVLFAAEAEDYLFSFNGGSRITDHAEELGILPPEEQIKKAIVRRAGKMRLDVKKLRKEAFSQGKFKAYLLTGLAMGVIGLVFGVNYFLLSMAGICIFLGAMTLLYKIKSE